MTAESWVYVDSTAIAALRQLRLDLAAEGVTLCLARAKGRLREILDATGLAEELGREHLFPTVRAGVAAFLARPEKRD